MLKSERVCGVFRTTKCLFKSWWHQPEIPVRFFSAGVGFKFGLYWRLHSDLLLLCHPTGFIVPSVYSLWKNWHHILKGYVEVWFPQHKLPWICQDLNVCLQRNEGEKALASCFQIFKLFCIQTMLFSPKVTCPVAVNSAVCFENGLSSFWNEFMQKCLCVFLFCISFLVVQVHF